LTLQLQLPEMQVLVIHILEPQEQKVRIIHIRAVEHLLELVQIIHMQDGLVEEIQITVIQELLEAQVFQYGTIIQIKELDLLMLAVRA
jgi:hypothetical protein